MPTESHSILMKQVWLSARLISLRKITEDADSPTSPGAQVPAPPSAQSPSLRLPDSNELSLPLSRAMAM